MQINRLFEIVYLLMEHGSIPASELAGRFEVSVRTVYRDIDALSEAGIPVYASRGRNGGISLLENFSLNRSLLSEREQDEILFALQSLKATDASQNDALLTRLSGLFRRERADWIEVDFSDWGNEAEQKEKFSMIRTGILERRMIRFSYYNSNGEEGRRRVEPVKLLFKGCWYLQGFCLMRNAYRTFKIRRMDHLILTGDHFNHRGEIPPPPVMTTDGAPVLNMELLFSPRAAFRVYDEFPPSRIHRQEDGSFLVSVSFPEGGWVYGYLLSFGENVKVLSPPDVREILQNKAEKIQSYYQ